MTRWRFAWWWGCGVVLALSLACHPPRTAAHLAGAFAGEDAGGTVRFGINCRDDGATAYGKLWLCWVTGESRLLDALWWRVLDAHGRLLSSAWGRADVVVTFPPGAARLEVLLPAEGWGRWRLAYTKEVTR